MKRILTLVIVMLCLGAISVFGQTKQISGTVIDQNGEPVIGATVRIDGTGIGTITGVDGGYVLEANEGDNIVVSFIGLETQTFAVGAESTMPTVTLIDSANLLDDVVITGYETIATRDFTGAASLIKNEEIENVPIASLDQVLQGQAAGLSILGSSGQPGASGTMFVRGISSSAAEIEPLLVIDGVPVDRDDLRTINPNDVASATILKDARASLMYGARGANGVIVITTKGGEAGKTKFSLATNQGTSIEPTDFLDLLNSNQKIDLELERGGTVLSSMTPQQIDALRQIETNWADEILRNGRFSSYEFTASGGSDNNTFYFSGNYFDQDGIVNTSGLKRYTGRLNYNNKGDFHRIGVNLTGGYSEQNTTRENDQFIGSPLNALYWSNPYETVFDADGNYTQLRSGQPNAVQELVLNKQNFTQQKAVASANGEFDLPWVDGLTLGTRWGIDFANNNDQIFLDPTTNTGGQSQGNQGELNRSTDDNLSLTGLVFGRYNRAIGEDHKFGIDLYHEYQKFRLSNFAFTGFGFGNTKFENEAGITAGTATNGFIPTVGGTSGKAVLLSYFANANYAFKDKYLLELGARRDGSSRFGANQRWQTGWFAGASWIVSDEDFMEGSADWLNFLKLRGSYGKSGNQEGIGFFASRELFGASTYNGVTGQTLTQLGNPNLAWEGILKANVGIDVGLFNNRINSTIELYNDKTDGLLFAEPLSLTTGFGTLTQNIGEIRNRGVEMSLNADVIRAGKFTWNFANQVAYNQSTILKLPENNADITTSIFIQRVGEAFNTNYVVPYVGVDPSNGDALYLTADGQVTNDFSQGGQQIFGPRQAPWQGGFTNTLSYDRFNLSGFVTWISGNKVFNNERLNIENPAFIPDNVSTDLLRAWRVPGDITDIPSLDNSYQSATSRYIEDGSFLRLRNVKLDYSLPSSLFNNKIRGISLYGQAQNLLTITNFTGADPERASGNFGGAIYPALRTFTGGVDIQF